WCARRTAISRNRFFLQKSLCWARGSVLPPLCPIYPTCGRDARGPRQGVFATPTKNVTIQAQGVVCRQPKITLRA
ncbi:MAG: hypothetical protein, partial [Olavius algarvensis Gamma 1 endosymbiont]